MDWFEKLFLNYANNYDKEEFTKGTLQEVDFLEQEFEFDKTKKILDVGCGTGRHSIELAKRGYNVVGCDLSDAQLAKAREKADKLGLDIEFVKADARNLPFEREFDFIICLCEGAFSLMTNDNDDFKVLQNIEMSLKIGGKLILTTTNALYQINCIVQGKGVGKYPLWEKNFDLTTFQATGEMEYTDDEGNKQKVEYIQRYYTPTEIDFRLGKLGFIKTEAFGCEIGNFSRDRAFNLDDYEILIIAYR